MLEESDIVQLISQVKKELNDILSGTEKNCRFDIFKTGRSKDFPDLKLQDLPMNIHFGAYTDDHQDVILEQVKCSFSSTDRVPSKSYFTRSLVRTCMSREALKISYSKAEYYLKLGRKDQLLFKHSTNKIKSNKRPQLHQNEKHFKKFKHEEKAKDDEECIFVKEEKLDETSMNKFKNPDYQQKTS